MTSCAVADCGNSSKKNKENIQPMIYHRFPKNKNLSHVWIVKCKRKDKINVINARVCSVHFLNSDYERDLRNELLGLPQTRLLKKTAIPSVFPNRPSPPVTIRTTTHANKKEQQDIVNQLLETRESELVQLKKTPEIPSTVEKCCQTTFNCTNLEENYSAQTRLLERKCAQIQRLKKKIALLESRLRGRKKKMKTSICSQLKFSPCQEKRLLGQNKHWGKTDIVNALSIRSISCAAYDCARKLWNLPLPAPRTLRTWASNFSCFPGILKDVMSALSAVGRNMESWEKVCGITFDEMSLSSLYVYDKAKECITSNSKVQVIMARGIFKPWKQPVYFEFDTKVTKEILFEVIKALDAAEFLVVSMTSDLGAENRSLWKSLEINVENGRFRHPCHEDKCVHVFADVPHMLKLIRNHILDDGIELEDGNRIDKSTFEIILKVDEAELKLCPKFSRYHLEVSGSERMRVRPAAELLSNHVAELSKRACPNQSWIYNFIKTLNDGFDVLNSSTKYNKNKLKSGYRVHLNEQISAITELRKLMKNSRFLLKGNREIPVKKIALLPCQVGMSVSITSTVLLFEELQSNFPKASYLLTSRLNQDCLENLFSQIRNLGGPGTHPTPVEFKYRLRLLLLGSKLRFPPGCSVASVEMNSDKVSIMSAELLNLNQFKRRNDVENETAQVTSKRKLSKLTNETTNKESLLYLAGYIAWKLKRKGKGDFGFVVPSSTRSKSWIAQLSRGGLLSPTNKLYRWIVECSNLFETFMNENASSAGIFSRLCQLISDKHAGIDKDVVQEFLKVRIKIRTKFLNSKRSQSIFLRRNKRKSKQFEMSSALRNV